MAPVEMAYKISDEDVNGIDMAEVNVVIFDARNPQEEELIEEATLSDNQDLTVSTGLSALVHTDGFLGTDLVDSFDGEVAGLINDVELRVGETVEGIVPGMTYIGR